MELLTLSEAVFYWNGWYDSPIKDLSDYDFRQKILNYAQFLKTPLNIEMFIGENRLFSGFRISQEEDCIEFEDIFAVALNNEGDWELLYKNIEELASEYGNYMNIEDNFNK